MPAKFRMTAGAVTDSADAHDWYENDRPGRGDRFLAAVNTCIRGIRRSPKSKAVWKRGYRRALVRKFPYLVIYKYDGETVTVFCLFHTSRDPKDLDDRLP